MTKHLLDLHRVDELKNFAANNLFRLVLFKPPSRSFSHFFPKSQKERSRGVIVEVLGPGAHYLYIYWACSQNPKVQIHSNFSKKEMN